MYITDEDIKNYRKGIDCKLTIDGITKSYPSYLVPLEGLYFNDLNGRIATYVEENASNPDKSIDLESLLRNNDLETYNDRIAEFIKQSANDGGVSFNKTKEDIKEKGQIKPGVILRSGRIIDGNRRFTCLRELYRDSGDTKYDFFECVILDDPQTKEQQRSIRSLELNLQFNVDEKKDYNKIDFLVGFYKDTMDTSSPVHFDMRAYCHASGTKEAVYNDYKNTVEVMLDYLEWRGKPKAFYILKNEKLDGPIEELAKKKKRLSPDEWNEKKTVMYTYMTFNRTGDRTRDLRKLLDSAIKDGTLYRQMKNEVEQPGVIEQLPNAVAQLDQKPANVEESKARDETLHSMQDNLIKTFNQGLYEESIENDANGPQKSLEAALASLQKINALQVSNFSKERKEELRKTIQSIEDCLDKLKDATN